MSVGPRTVTIKADEGKEKKSLVAKTNRKWPYFFHLQSHQKPLSKSAAGYRGSRMADLTGTSFWWWCRTREALPRWSFTDRGAMHETNDRRCYAPCVTHLCWGYPRTH